MGRLPTSTGEEGGTDTWRGWGAGVQDIAGGTGAQTRDTATERCAAPPAHVPGQGRRRGSGVNGESRPALREVRRVKGGGVHTAYHQRAWALRSQRGSEPGSSRGTSGNFSGLHFPCLKKRGAAALRAPVTARHAPCSLCTRVPVGDLVRPLGGGPDAWLQQPPAPWKMRLGCLSAPSSGPRRHFRGHGTSHSSSCRTQDASSVRPCTGNGSQSRRRC